MSKYDAVVAVEGGLVSEVVGNVLVIDFDNAEQDWQYARDMVELLAQKVADKAIAPDTAADLMEQLAPYAKEA